MGERLEGSGEAWGREDGQERVGDSSTVAVTLTSVSRPMSLESR